jgi:putative hydrolase of the HAD superfamily
MIRAIIIDFGRVISKQKPPSLFRRYEEELGLETDTINAIMFESQTWQDALTGRKTEEEFWREIGPELGLRAPAEIDAFHRRYHTDEAINHGVVNLLRLFHGRYKLAMLSNSPPGLDQWLHDWGIKELFDVVFCSGDEGLVKPDAAAYQMVLDRLTVEAEEAVFIDDTLDHVLAARMLGLQGVLFTTAEELEAQLAELLERQDDEQVQSSTTVTNRTP